MDGPHSVIARRYPGLDAGALHNASTLLELALAEDMGTPLPCLWFDPARKETHGIAFRVLTPDHEAGDVTSAATIPQSARGAGVFVARREGRLAGMPVAHLAALRLGLAWFEPLAEDGAALSPGTGVARAWGEMRTLLALERIALNFLQHLSGVATATARFVQAVAGTRAEIIDTRKTTPGWRALEKYAVRCGGGTNHRGGLYDAILIKDNHLAWLAALENGDPIAAAVSRAWAYRGKVRFIEVEVDTLEQFDRALAAGPDIILLDNFGTADLAEAVRRRDASGSGVLLEASGGVTLDTVREIAATGVDRISVGAITHSAPALDLALDFETDRPE